MTIAERYWHFLVELRAHTAYVTQYHSEMESTDRRVSGFTALVSSTSIAGWAIWSQFSYVWACLVAASQVLNALKPFLPYRMRLVPLRSVAYAFEDLFVKTESKWFSIEQGQLTEEEISDLLNDFRAEKVKRWKSIVGNVSLPQKLNLAEKADRESELYFQTHY